MILNIFSVLIYHSYACFGEIFVHIFCSFLKLFYFLIIQSWVFRVLYILDASPLSVYNLQTFFPCVTCFSFSLVSFEEQLFLILLMFRILLKFSFSFLHFTFILYLWNLYSIYALKYFSPMVSVKSHIV